jgi:antirestriction protein ArdC
MDEGQTNEEKTKELLATLETKILGLDSDESWKEYLRYQAMLPNYSFNNVLLLSGQRVNGPNGPQSPTSVASFGTWMKLNNPVAKGTKSLKVIAPLMGKRERTDERTGEKHDDPVIRGWKAVSVFDISQTVNPDAMPSPVANIEGEGNDRLQAMAIKAVEELSGYRVEFGAIGDGVNGWTKPSEKLIRVDDTNERSKSDVLRTVFHEMGHAILHGEGNTVCSDPRSDKELEAESTAFTLASHYGISTDKYSLAYITHWTGSDPKETVKKLREHGSRIQGAVNKVVQHIDGQMKAEMETAELAPSKVLELNQHRGDVAPPQRRRRAPQRARDDGERSRVVEAPALER